MKFKQFVELLFDPDGFIPTGHLRWDIRKNERKTAREEAIAAEVFRQANPRENITGHFPWGPEEQMVLQQLWVKPSTEYVEWRDVQVAGAKELYTTVPTEHGDMPVPNAVKEPESVQADFRQRVRDAIGE